MKEISKLEYYQAWSKELYFKTGSAGCTYIDLKHDK